MLDLGFVRDHLPLVEEKLRQRGMNPAAVLNDFQAIDLERRAAITEAETLKAHRNKASEEIATLKKNKQDATALINETKELREKISAAEKVADEADARLRNILLGIPNLPDDSVPVGKGEADNVEVRRWGTPPQFDFTPKPHWELGEELGVLDLERAAKLTGARFAVYWDMGAKLGAGADELHARPAHPRAWLHRSAATVHGQRGIHVWHRAICRSLRPICLRCHTATRTFT